MARPPFVGHRRYSITHRAVQRLRELVHGRDDEDDESLRDQLDAALTSAQDDGKAIRTLDAMLGEPQTLIPVETFGDALFAIIKEDTVVTVLPQGHGEEILHRGQAMEQRVASGQAPPRTPEREEGWDAGVPRRRWRKDGGPVVVERVRTPAPTPGPTVVCADPSESPPVAAAKVYALPERRRVDGALAGVLEAALERGRRSAAVATVAEALRSESSDTSLVNLWNAMADEALPQTMTIGDLRKAVIDAER